MNSIRVSLQTTKLDFQTHSWPTQVAESPSQHLQKSSKHALIKRKQQLCTQEFGAPGLEFMTDKQSNLNNRHTDDSTAKRNKVKYNVLRHGKPNQAVHGHSIRSK